MNGINIITRNHIPDHVNYPVLRLFISRVEIECITIPNEPLGMELRDMVRGDRSFADAEISAVWIAPCMVFKPSFMRFLDRKSHWVIVRHRRLALRTG